jgi:tRNA A-37 threonylcarbamoyl transferase component Bud32
MGNLRWVEGSLRVLDCGSIAARRKPLEPRRALDNLALQLVEFPSLGAPELDVLYQAYCRRSGLDSQRYLPLFMRLFRRQRRYHIRKNVAKAFRTCTAYLAHRDSRVRWVCDRGFDSPDLRRFLDDPDQYVRSAQPALVKDGNSAKVWRLSMDGRAVAVKRYNIKSATHGLRRAVTRSRAARSWENAQRLRLLAIPTPRPVSFVEQRFGTLRRAAWLVNEWVDGRPAAEYFDGETRRCPANTRAARELVAIIQRLGDEGILHGDLKATNFLIGPHGPVLIDLDAMRSRISGRDWRRGRARDLQRFRRNWPESVWNSFFAHPFGDMRP